VSGSHRAFAAARRVRRAPLFAWAGSSFMLAAAGVAVWKSSGDVGHGWWLASFLALVGGVAQLLLGAGHRALSAQTPAGQARSSSAQLFVVWNAGALLVPVGVLTEARAAVVAGSVALLAVLGCLSLALRGSSQSSTGRISRLHIAYLALVTFLTASVLVGTGLAWDLPWV
jgi:hypothetical protein